MSEKKRGEDGQSSALPQRRRGGGLRAWMGPPFLEDIRPDHLQGIVDELEARGEEEGAPERPSQRPAQRPTL